MSTSNAPLPDKALAGADAPLDEVMLAMDVVDTLRHDHAMLEADLNSATREADLIARLRDIYTAQGIDVPDHILKEGVAALEDERFAFHPPKKGFGTSLAQAYISRGKWGKPILALAALLAFVWTTHYAIVSFPQQQDAKRVQVLLEETIPSALEEARNDALSVAKTDAIKSRINALYDDGLAAARSGDEDGARNAQRALTDLSTDLRASYAIRVVSRSDEYSGVFRIPDSNQAARNYYLIVEAVTPEGKTVPVTIASEEDQRTARTSIWGVRVPKSVFDQIADDKSDDQIIQNAIIGAKARGVLEPQFSVATSGGYILEW